MLTRLRLLYFFFFFNDTATTEIYTLSLHDALPISAIASSTSWPIVGCLAWALRCDQRDSGGTQKMLCARYSSGSSGSDRKSTRLNSSHLVISYAVFCLKKKKTLAHRPHPTRHRMSD